MNASTLSISVPGSPEALKGKVLCVDDEPNILRALSWLLRKDFQVLTATTAEEGLELVRTGDFDVVISDQRMPEMSGVDFLNQVKTISPRSMRILLTGYSDMQAILKSVNESEVFRFITKPWDVVELPMIVAQAAEIARRQENIAPKTVPAALREVHGAGLPKLLVLDEDDATHSAVEMSAGDLAQIIHVTSPVDAFKMLEDEEIGIILSERKLGSMDLTHLLCLLKRKHPQIISIIVTESEDSNLICRMINQGQIYRFMPKPLKAGKLRLMLKDALAKRQELLETPQLAERYQVAEIQEEEARHLKNQMAAQLADNHGHENASGTDSPSLLQKLGGLFHRLFPH